MTLQTGTGFEMNFIFIKTFKENTPTICPPPSGVVMNCIRPSHQFILVVKVTFVKGLQLKIKVCFMSDEAILCGLGTFK